MQRRAAAWTKGKGEERKERRVLQKEEWNCLSHERTVSVEEEEEAAEVEEDEGRSNPLSMLADTHLHNACSAATTTRGLPVETSAPLPPVACCKILGRLFKSLTEARAASSRDLMDWIVARSPSARGGAVIGTRWMAGGWVMDGEE
jgi:hypothetical protein